MLTNESHQLLGSLDSLLKLQYQGNWEKKIKEKDLGTLHICGLSFFI